MTIFMVFQALGFAVFAGGLSVLVNITGFARVVSVLFGYALGILINYFAPQQLGGNISVTVSFIGLSLILSSQRSIHLLNSDFKTIRIRILIYLLASTVPLLVLGYLFRDNTFIFLVFAVTIAFVLVSAALAIIWHMRKS